MSIELIQLPEETALNKLQGHLSLIEGQLLATLAARVPAKQGIVEIGSYKGKSTCWLATGSKAGHRARVFAIDLWTKGWSKPYKAPETFAAFQEQVAAMGHSDLIRAIMMPSLEAVKGRKKPIGLLFIDGSHKYQACRDDYEAWERFVPAGGYVAFHDYSEKQPGVMRVVDEIVAASDRWEHLGVYDRIWVGQRRG